MSLYSCNTPSSGENVVLESRLLIDQMMLVPGRGGKVGDLRNLSVMRVPATGGLKRHWQLLPRHLAGRSGLVRSVVAQGHRER